MSRYIVSFLRGLNRFYSSTTCREKGDLRARAHSHARNLQSPEALGPEIEEGAVNRRPPSGVVPPSSGRRTARYHPVLHLEPAYVLRHRCFILLNIRPSTAAIGRPDRPLFDDEVQTFVPSRPTSRFLPPPAVEPCDGVGGRDFCIAESFN